MMMIQNPKPRRSPTVEAAQVDAVFNSLTLDHRLNLRITNEHTPNIPSSGNLISHYRFALYDEVEQSNGNRCCHIKT